MLDSLFCRGSASKCKSLIKEINSRIETQRKRRKQKAGLQRKDITELLNRGEDQKALGRVDILFTEENVLAVYDMIENFCNCVLRQLSSIQKHKDCPQDIKEAVSSLIFAAARCAEIPELQALRGIFATKYGDDFAIAAVDLHPGCDVSQQIIEKLSSGVPTSDTKLSILRMIAKEEGIQWEYSNLKDHSKRQESFMSSHDRVDSSHQLVPPKMIAEDTVMYHMTNHRNHENKYLSDANRQKGQVSSTREDCRRLGCKEDIYERVIPVVSTSVKEISTVSNNLEGNPEPSFSSNTHVKKCAAEPVNWVDRETYSYCDRSSYKQRLKAEVVDHSIHTGLEKQEDTRQAYNGSWKSKNSMHTTGSQCEELNTRSRKCHPDPAFHEEKEYIHAKDTNGNTYSYSKEQSKDFNRKYIKEHGNLDGRKFQEFSAEPEYSKLQDSYNIRREGSRTATGINQYGENSVQHSRYGGNNRSSRCRESSSENKDLDLFDKPFEQFHTEATEGCKSDYENLPRNKSKLKSKSNKMHSGSTIHDVETGNVNNTNFDEGLYYPSIEPSIKKSIGGKLYNEGFIEPQEGSTCKKVVANHGYKLDSTSQCSVDQINKQVHDGWDSYHGSKDYCNALDSSNLTSTYVAGYGPYPVHERLNHRGSGRRLYYVNEDDLQDETNPNIRSEAHNKDGKSVNRKINKVANASHQVEDEQDHQSYNSVQATLYEGNERNLTFYGRPPYELKKPREKGEQRNSTSTDMDSSFNSGKKIHENVGHVSYKDRNLWQSVRTKEDTKYTYPEDSSFDGERSSLNGNSALLEHTRAYQSDLKGVHQMDGSAELSRHHRIESERKQKVSSNHSNVQRAQHNGICEARDIQHTKSARSRNKQGANEIQYQNQSAGLQSTGVGTDSRYKSNYYASPHHYSTSNPLSPLPLSSPATKSSYTSPEEKFHKSTSPVNELPSQSPLLEPHRAVSMPNNPPARSDPLQAKLLKSSSDVGISSTRHVHPKLPNYEDLNARFAALKQQHKASTSE